VIRAIAAGEAAYPRRLLPHVLADLSAVPKGR
jgi:hypothetical protein